MLLVKKSFQPGEDLLVYRHSLDGAERRRRCLMRRKGPGHFLPSFQKVPIEQT
jgi:hypothetical protein